MEQRKHKIKPGNSPDNGYQALMQNYQQTLSLVVGPTKTFVIGETLQLKDYAKLDWEWSMFDPEANGYGMRLFFRWNARKYEKWVRH